MRATEAILKHSLRPTYTKIFSLGKFSLEMACDLSVTRVWNMASFNWKDVPRIINFLTIRNSSLRFFINRSSSGLVRGDELNLSNIPPIFPTYTAYLLKTLSPTGNISAVGRKKFILIPRHPLFELKFVLFLNQTHRLPYYILTQTNFPNGDLFRAVSTFATHLSRTNLTNQRIQPLYNIRV